jgi:hypothetical protein
MGDPTFTQQFGLAAQADILRQAAADRQDWQPPHDYQPGISRLAGLASRLTGAFRLQPGQRRDLAARPAQRPDC